MSNSLDPDSGPIFLVHDLGPDCFQRLSADDTSSQRVKLMYEKIITIPMHKVFA